MEEIDVPGSFGYCLAENVNLLSARLVFEYFL
jgi:hypothetical protein